MFSFCSGKRDKKEWTIENLDNGISTIVSSVENKSGEETVSDNSSDENLNPWYRKYYPDLTDDDVRKIEAVHEANRRLIAEYESQNHKGR